MPKKTRPDLTIEIPLYRSDIEVFFTRGKMRQFILDQNGPDIGVDDWYVGRISSFTTKAGYYQQCIEFPKAIEISTLAHEMLHIAHRILNQKGVETSYLNDEALTYLMTFLIDEFYIKLGRKQPMIPRSKLKKSKS